MKLTSSLPERPGWIFVTPGFDFLLLLMALVLLTGVVARETMVEVEPPPSEFRGLRMRGDDLLVLTVRQGRNEPLYYLNRQLVKAEDLPAALAKGADEKKFRKVAARFDRRIDLGTEQQVMDQVTRLGLEYFRVVEAPEDQ